MNRINFSKYTDSRGYNTFYLKNNNNVELTISFEGNLDLYFSLNNFDNEPYFIIDNNNYTLYKLFDRLYSDVKNCNIFDESGTNYYEEYKDRYEYNELFKDGIITWKCDDYPIEIAPSFNIIKEEDRYIIKFTPRIKSEDFNDFIYTIGYRDRISIRIRNSGSRYNPFNCIFMRLYRSLSKIDELDLDQVHMEEYLLKKKKKLIK